MTIGIDCRLYSQRHTGIGRYVFELVRNLEIIDKENQYVLYFNQPEFETFQPQNERWQKTLVNIPHYSIAEQTRLWFFLNHELIDLMHFPHFNAPILYRKPFVVTIHDLTLHHFPYKSYSPNWSPKKAIQIVMYRLLMRTIVKSAQHIIAVSDYTKNDLIKTYQLDKAKITRIYEGVHEDLKKSDSVTIEAVKKRFCITKPYLFYTGVSRSHKNLLNLIRAFKILLDEKNDLQLVLGGKKDSCYPEIHALIKEKGLENKVIMTDFLSDDELTALMSGAQIFVFPSLSEGFGLPPLEAMTLEVPCAVSNATSLPEICGDAAVYFDPLNPKDMAKTIKNALFDQALRLELIEKGKKNLRKYSFHQMTKEILDIYKMICDNSILKKKSGPSRFTLVS